MAGNPVAGIDLEIRLEAFRAELKKAREEGGKEFKGLAVDIERELKKTTAALKKVGTDTREAKSGFDALDSAASKTGRSANQLAGFLGLISPEAADAARTVGDLADVGEVAATSGQALGVSLGSLLSVLGPVALAVGAGAIAWKVYASELEAATAKAEAAAKVATESQQRLATVESLRIDIEDELAIATGKATREDVALRGELKKITDFYGPLIDAKRADYEQSLKTRAAYGGQHSETVKLRTELQGLEEQQGALLTKAAQGNILGRKVVEGKHAEAKAAGVVLTVEEQIAALREKLAGEEADRRAAVLSQESADALAGAAMMAAVEEDQTRKHNEELQKRLDDERKAAAEARAIQEAELNAYGQLFGGISDLSGTLAESMKDDSEGAAQAAFAISKAAGLAQAAVNTALAISNALAQPVPPPVAALMAVAAGAAGAAQVAAIAATPPPSFNDTPGVMQVGQGRGQTVKFAGGDYFAAAKSPDDLKRKVGNDGDIFGGRSAPTVRISNRGFDYFMRDTLRANNRTSRAVRGSSRVGHRER